MRRRSKVHCFGAVCAAAAAMMVGTVTMAQALQPGGAAATEQETQAPTSAAPQPNLRKSYPVWLGYIVILIMVLGVMGISLLPSKRSHQD